MADAHRNLKGMAVYTHRALAILIAFFIQWPLTLHAQNSPVATAILKRNCEVVVARVKADPQKGCSWDIKSYIRQAGDFAGKDPGFHEAEKYCLPKFIEAQKYCDTIANKAPRSSVGSSGNGCYACRITANFNDHNYHTVTDEDSPVCVSPGENPERLVYDAVRSHRALEIPYYPAFGPQVKCLDAKRRAELITFKTDGTEGSSGIGGFVSENFVTERRRSYQADSKVQNAGSDEDKNRSECVSLIDNTAYGERAMTNKCPEPVEVAFCYLGSNNKSFECTPGRKDGWQRGSHTVKPGGRNILPDSKKGHRVIWFACEKGNVPKITGYDERRKVPLGHCR